MGAPATLDELRKRFDVPLTDEGVDADAVTDDVIAAINATGEAFFSGTTWRGERAMRVSVVSWKTTDEDVDRVVRAVAKVLEP